uniref:Uncharacterized protein n=1 Tax=Cucumis melo TaxID=3656 RepID=A0A9I9E6B2_CUCME
MDISPDTLDWIRKCFKALLETSNTKHFFNERRQEDYCMWVRKTKNKSKSGSTAEIFRIDNKGRKCSVLVPEGIDKFETSRKSYAIALMESSDDGRDKKNNIHFDDSSCKRSSTTAHSMKAPLRKAFENASILLTDNQGENFVVNTVPPPKGRWFIERNVNFHGTFKIEAADDFDSLNPNAEEFTFAENHAIPLKNSKNQSDSKQSKPDKNSDSNPTHAKKNSSSESEYDPFDQNSDDRRKETERPSCQLMIKIFAITQPNKKDEQRGKYHLNHLAVIPPTIHISQRDKI